MLLKLSTAQSEIPNESASESEAGNHHSSSVILALRFWAQGCGYDLGHSSSIPMGVEWKTLLYLDLGTHSQGIKINLESPTMSCPIIMLWFWHVKYQHWIQNFKCDMQLASLNSEHWWTNKWGSNCFTNVLNNLLDMIMLLQCPVILHGARKIIISPYWVLLNNLYTVSLWPPKPIKNFSPKHKWC